MKTLKETLSCYCYNEPIRRNETETEPCPVCGKNRFEDLSETEFAGDAPVTINHGLEACCYCGVVRKKRRR